MTEIENDLSAKQVPSVSLMMHGFVDPLAEIGVENYSEAQPVFDTHDGHDPAYKLHVTELLSGS